jgi:ribosome-associated protein YbcJ (S4-like RNA binding protein)
MVQGIGVNVTGSQNTAVVYNMTPDVRYKGIKETRKTRKIGYSDTNLNRKCHR